MTNTLICLVRHGETDWNKRGILQGWTDVPINDLGRHQAYEIAQACAQAGFDGVWSSPLVRAFETARIIAEALQLKPPSRHEGLKERHFGATQGIPKDELAEQNPAQLEQILRRNPAAQFVGGESMDEFADRVLGAVIDIGHLHRNQKVLAISHGWVLDVVNRQVAGLPRHVVLAEKPKNGESVWVRVDGDGIGITQSSSSAVPRNSIGSAVMGR
jgi:probable phosphoglycerate mutase